MARQAGADPIDVAVGRRLRLLRRRRKLSQARLAGAMGVSFQQLQKYETGANRISASALLRAANALDAPPAALLGDAADGGSIDAELLDLLARPGAEALLRSFASITDREARAALVAIAGKLAGMGA